MSDTGASSAMAQLLARLGALDIRLALDGERLTVNAPKGALTPELRAELGQHKVAILEHLRRHPPAPTGASNPPPAPAAPGVAAPTTRLAPVPRTAQMPVAHNQQRLWFLRQLAPASTTYTIGAVMSIDGPLDDEALERTLVDLVRRHESLRSRFRSADGTPYCEIDAEPRSRLRRHDVSHLPEGEREAASFSEIDREFETPFDLEQGPLVRFLLVRLSPRCAHFALLADHIVADGISVGIFLAEMLHLYRSHLGEPVAALRPLPIQYLDHVVWQRGVLSAGMLDTNLTFWKQQLQDMPPVLNLPTDRPRPRLQSQRGSRVIVIWPPETAATLKALARKEGVTLYMLLLAAFQVLLSRYSSEADFGVGSVVGAREEAGLEGVVGFFANNIVLRADLSGRPTVRELLQRVRATAFKAYAHQQMPFDVLVDALATRRDLDHSPLFQVLFVLHSHMPTESRLGEAVCTPIEPPWRTARFDLSLDIFDRPEGLRTYVEYNTDLFEPTTIERLLDHLHHLLHAMVASPEAPVDDLPLVDMSQEAQLLQQWRGPTLPAPAVGEETVHGLFAAQAARTPDAEALRFGSEALSYAQLDARANRLARHLQQRGVAAGTLVGVWLERSAEMAVALLAALKAGAAYVPLDPAFPRDRIEFMVQDAEMSAVVTTAALAATLPAGQAAIVTLDEEREQIDRQAPQPLPQVDNGTRQLAYVIYTSGSTGRPKGVMIEHAAVVNFLRSMHREPGIGPHDRWVSVTTLSFDIFGLELWGPLTAGGTVVLASRATALDGQALARLLREERATILQATPATWRLLVETGWQGAPGLKMLCGGEALPRDLAARLLGLGGELWNMYGPTETTIWSTLSRITDAALPITIGRPIAETSIAVLEASGRVAVPGVAGELCIGGAGVARGYLNRAELTAEKFVELSLAGRPPERFYRTGDLARIRGDGTLEFIGRRDHQIKLRGYRIELGEIEAALAEVPGVQQAVVVVREDAPGDQRLVAYVVAAETFTADAARQALRGRLPEYMVLNLFVPMPAMPLTPNGKVDRKALPAPRNEASADTADAAALMGPAEQRVAAAWRDLLGVARVGLHDNFFDLGGHSLLLVKLQARLQREFGAEVPLVELFQHTTVQTQAARFDREVGPEGMPRDATPGTDALLRARARAEKLQQGMPT